MSGTNRKRQAKSIMREQGLTYMQALDLVLAAESAAPAMTVCGSCGFEIIPCDKNESLTGWTHVQNGGKAGGRFCNPDYTPDNIFSQASPDTAEVSFAAPTVTDAPVSVTAVFERSTVTVTVPFPTYDLTLGGWSDYLGIDVTGFEESVQAVLLNEGIDQEYDDLVIDGEPLEDALRELVYNALAEAGRVDRTRTYSAAEVIYSRHGQYAVIDYVETITAFGIDWGMCEGCEVESPTDPVDSGMCLVCGSAIETLGVAGNPLAGQSADGMVKVEWIYLDEGRSGEFDDSDPEDEALLRYDAYIRLDSDESVNRSRGVQVDVSSADGHLWGTKEDSSYCTNTPYDTDPETLRALARLIANELADNLDNGGWKSRAEEMSHVHPDWVKAK